MTFRNATFSNSGAMMRESVHACAPATPPIASAVGGRDAVPLHPAGCTVMRRTNCSRARNPPRHRHRLLRSGGGGRHRQLQAAGSTAQRTTLTDQTGSFHFSAVEPGAYTLTITAGGFADWKTKVSVVSGENPPLPPVVLQIAPAISKVDVGLPPHELATQQVHAEEKQRLLGIFPNFYVSYDRNAAPLTAAQKFQLGLRTIIDPEVILGNAASAGIEQWHNTLTANSARGWKGMASALARTMPPASSMS